MSPTNGEIRVNVADYAVATQGTIATIGLGSCVAIVLHDPDRARRRASPCVAAEPVDVARPVEPGRSFHRPYFRFC